MRKRYNFKSDITKNLLSRLIQSNQDEYELDEGLKERWDLFINLFIEYKLREQGKSRSETDNEEIERLKENIIQGIEQMSQNLAIPSISQIEGMENNSEKGMYTIAYLNMQLKKRNLISEGV